MSYFFLPRNNITNININFVLNNEIKNIPTSIFNYYIKLYNEINNLIVNDPLMYFYNYEKIIKIMNPYEYIYCNIPGSKFSVSKLKTKSLLFYDLIEIHNSLDLFSYNKYRSDILIISPNFEDFTHYIDLMINDNNNDNITCLFKLDNMSCNMIRNKKYDFIYYEEPINVDTNPKLYVNSIIKVLFVILNCQANDGNCLIKIDNIFYKPIIEILYLLTTIFEKVYIFKPNTINVATGEKYIVCKTFISYKITKINTSITVKESEKIIVKEPETKDNNLVEMVNYLNDLNNITIVSLLDKEIPCYFLNKIYDLNSILVQQQLEVMEQLITILKTKNREEKMEILKKNNMQKSIIWCEKFKIPYNKFTEKTNMFLSIPKDINMIDNVLDNGLDNGLNNGLDNRLNNFLENDNIHDDNEFI